MKLEPIRFYFFWSMSNSSWTEIFWFPTFSIYIDLKRVIYVLSVTIVQSHASCTVIYCNFQGEIS